MFKSATLLAAELLPRLEPGSPPPVRWGPLVVLPGYSDGLMLWAPVYWIALGPLVLCLRAAPSAVGVGLFRSPSVAVDWGLVV